MAPRSGPPIDEGIIARVVSGVRYAITGKTPTSWFGPGEPIAPVAQQVAGRQFDFPVATNIQITPRANEPISFHSLRGLADSCDIVRLAIETRKDQMGKLGWTIQPKDKSAKPDQRADDLIAFFSYPDKTHDWHTWLRMLLEDLLVIDAPALYVRLTNNNKLYALEPIDGATIKRLLDDQGRVPLAPDPAYQQILHGVPAVDYSSDELLYLPRNVRTHKIYGYSPVEQIIITANTLIRKTLHQLQYYTAGSVPDAIIGVPPTWQPDQIAAFQRYWDEELSGNTANRRQVKFVADGVNFHPTKTEPLKDEFDDWLARIVCYAFSLPPTPFIKQANKATAESAQDAALEEGLLPLMQWVKAAIDRIIITYFGYTDLEFVWPNEQENDPLIQAQINQIYVTTGVKTTNEVRTELGLEVVAAPKVVTAPPVSDGKKLAKQHQITPINRQRPVVKTAVTQLSGILTKLFAKENKRLTRDILAAYSMATKADDDNDSGEIAESLDFSGWMAIVGVTRKQLATVAQDGGAEGLGQLGVTDSDIANTIADTAAEDAKYRAAELVGKKYVGGKLIDNPDAKWTITESTRDRLRATIDQAMQEGWSTNMLAGEISNNDAFSATRAQMIARTEIARADMHGSMIAYRASGVVDSKEWLLGDAACDICQANAAEGIIPLDQDFSSGDDAAPAHPNCECTVSPVVAPLAAG